MDIALLNRGWNRTWSDTMVNLEARKLVETANRLSAFYLQDGITRIKFVEEIKQVVEKEFEAARRAKTDEECIVCIKNLRAETDNLHEQERLLRTRAAQLYAKVEFVREKNKIVGYMISAVNIVISGMVFYGGMIMISTLTPIGVLAGAILVSDGTNGVTREVNKLLSGGKSNSEGVVADKVISIAQFMGFKAESGLAFYNTLTLSANIYSIFGLARKTGAWRLFRWLPHDYYRKVNTMSRPKLTMKIVGYGIKAKVIFDLLSTEAPNH
ncbi:MULTISPECIES: DUF4225 domain-containing protein [Enterobacter]|uniref:DUF4225 domain-containing protein n=1 Tax=Enterobacter TaxID=547 RepID=UPI0013D8A2F1|nr:MULTISPECIES: DUF4225 domain-containing protein [Enterobacter cloacae complex]ELE9704556.1 DUF4225 domain-containing protein [Enterobacter cloacae]MBA7850792.1 DUF4225 domain-containing protein [Enterobacter cloacae]MCR6730702.1 DUF4225 domain-containing protein [Enterobacter cloacae]MCU6228537.1 DUF4225 domain-containing protein [Enterobacter cloacae]UUR78821.1 DUF4225 domain-containing protein [Enterobacter cloacae complex sp. R_G8]